MTEAVQPQMPFFPQEAEFRTPEEIMVSLMAQTIIQQTALPTAKMELERPFGMDKPQEKEKAKEKELEKQESSKNTSDTKSVERAKSEAPEERAVAKEMAKEAQPHKERAQLPQKLHQTATMAKERAAEKSAHFETAQTSSQPIPLKPNVPPPPQQMRTHHDHREAAKDLGTSRRAMPQPPQAKETSSFVFDRKVDKDREENQKRKPSLFQRGRIKKASGTSKVKFVANKHFNRDAHTDYERFLRMMMQDSELSSYFGVRVSHFDVMLLFIELMKLEVEDNHQERISRLEERKNQIAWMEGVVKQYKQQAKFLLFAGVGAGALGVLSGALPIIGHVKGDWILDKIKMVYSGFNNMKRVKAFDNISKMCFSMSEMNKAMGQVQSSFCDGERSWAEHKSSLHRSDSEESTRTIEERTRDFKTWNEILAQLLRMEQDLARQLYQ